MTAIAAASQAIELLKGLNEIDKEYDRAELKAKVAELLSSVADLKVTTHRSQRGHGWARRRDRASQARS